MCLRFLGQCGFLGTTLGPCHSVDLGWDTILCIFNKHPKRILKRCSWTPLVGNIVSWLWWWLHSIPPLLIWACVRPEWPEAWQWSQAFQGRLGWRNPHWDKIIKARPMPVKGLYSSQILWEDETRSQQEDNVIPNLVHDGFIYFLFLAMLYLCGCAGFTIVATSRA